MPMQFDSFFEYESAEDLAGFFHRKKTSAQEMFAHIAAIEIYHHADVSFKKAAEHGLNSLVSLLGEDWVRDTLSRAGTLEIHEDQVQCGNVRWWYNALFAVIAEDMLSESEHEFQFEIDEYGGFNYVVGPENEICFGSDDSHVFPFFTCAEAMQERLDHQSFRGKMSSLSM